MSDIDAKVKAAHESLTSRVLRVAALHRKCAITGGAGRLTWIIGAPLLAILLLQVWVGLPFYLRVPVLPAVVIGLIWLGWKLIVRPLRERYSVTRAALLVEAGRPQLGTKLVSSLECYDDLRATPARFDPSMVRALVLQTARVTDGDDFEKVIDPRPARRQLFAGGGALALWAAALILWPGAMAGAMGSLFDAWNDVRNIAQKMSGARIVVDALDRPAYLKGSDVVIRAAQHGFHAPDMVALIRDQNQEQWRPTTVRVGADGRAEYVAKNVGDTFEVYFTSGRIESERRSVIVTERPRIANLSVEYDLPEYTRRAPITQPRSDGNLEAVYGSTIIVTITANKPIKRAELKGSFLGKAEKLSVAGEYARAVIRLNDSRWLADGPPSREQYFLTLTDEYGYGNEDAERSYSLIVSRDKGPEVAFLGLPHRSDKDEPHLLEARVAGMGAVVKAADDYGVNRLTLNYRIEDLETGATKSQGKRDQLFPLPRADIPQAVLLRFAEIGAVAGDRVVFWAEAEDAYDLEPAKGPHKTVTPTYRIAVVSQEETFNEAVYKDDWSTQWYDSLKLATLSRREIPPRQSAEREPAADVAKKLLDAPQAGDSLHGSDKQLIQDYFDSLNVLKPGR